MRISDLISLGQRYLTLGLVAATVLAAGFYIIYKMFLKGKIQIRPSKVIWAGISVCYLIVVLGVTLMNRGSFYQNRAIMPLFYSYKDAWIDFSYTAWRNIILNICMFVPFGILVPIGIKCFRSFLKTSLAGLLFTAFIEGCQFFMNLGLFELDDLLNNTVGAMIGYGVYAFVTYIVCLKKKHDNQSRKPIIVMALQLPLIITIIIFSAIFVSYHNQELGNIAGQYIQKYDTDKIHISTTANFSDDKVTLPVYTSPVLTKEETIQFAEQFFEALGTELDVSQNDFYEDTVAFRAFERYSLWVDYSGGIYNFTDFSTNFPDESLHVVTNATEEEIRQKLQNYSIEVPAEATFEVTESGKYKFSINQFVSGNTIKDGILTCEYYDNGCFARINNSIITCEIYKEFEAISEQEAYNKICAGEFRVYGSENLNIVVKDCVLTYIIDSKGFYQPVYDFETELNGVNYNLQIPALEY